MAVEARRRCGYRKKGGLYLESEPGPGFACGRLPLRLAPCPLCDHELVQHRGLERINPNVLLHSAKECERHQVAANPWTGCDACPLSSALASKEPAGLMWVGDRFYSPESFAEEAERLGVSKRLAQIPKWLTPGMRPWVFLAHPARLSDPCLACHAKGMREDGEEATMCPECSGAGRVPVPGIFFAFRMSRVVKIVGDATSQAERDALRARGVEPVVVPENDPDHRPSPRRGQEEEE